MSEIEKKRKKKEGGGSSDVASKKKPKHHAEERDDAAGAEREEDAGEPEGPRRRHSKRDVGCAAGEDAGEGSSEKRKHRHHRKKEQPTEAEVLRRLERAKRRSNEAAADVLEEYEEKKRPYIEELLVRQIEEITQRYDAQEKPLVDELLLRNLLTPVRIVIIGDADVGKTSLMTRFVEDSMCDPSRDYESMNKEVTVDGKRVKVSIADTQGQERFRQLTSATYQGADGVILVYNVAERATFKHTEQWVGDVARYTQNRALVQCLVGNKTDLEDQRRVSEEAGRARAAEFGMHYYETSALSGANVAELFDWMVREILRATQDKSPSPAPAGTAEASGGRGCCVLQ